MEFTFSDVMLIISAIWDQARAWLFGGFSSMGGGLSTVVSLVFVIFVVATYAFNGYQRLYMGRKAGVEKDWMAFVPFSRSLYRTRMVGRPWWWMLLIGETPFYAIALFLVLVLINGILALIALVLYLFASAGFKLYYRRLLLQAFGICPTLALLQITFIGTYPLRVLDILIAFTRTYAFEGLQAPAYIPGTSAEQAKPTGASGTQQAKTGSITGLSGMYAGQDIPVSASEEIVIGRNSDECNIIITQNADKVSRKHCGILFDPATGGYKVTDYSSNGIFVDGGNRLAANIPSTLLRGTVIALGSRENRFRLN